MGNETNKPIKMKTSRIISLFAVLIIVTLTISYNSCSKTEETPTNTVPLLSTRIASGVTNSSATVGGIITSNGGATVTIRGVCIVLLQILLSLTTLFNQEVELEPLIVK